MLHHVELGNPTGPPLLLVHGFMSSRVQWDLNVDRLGQTLRLVLVELPGHGDSPAPDDPAPYRRDAVFASLEQIRHDLAIDRWFVCGHSLGGATVLRYALAHPEVVRGTIFTNSRAAFGTARAGTEASGETSGGGDDPIDTGDLRALPFHPVHAKRFPADIKARMVERADAMHPHALRHTVAQRRTWSSADELHRLQGPLLLVNGRWEKAFQPSVEAARLARPDIEIVELEGGHSINVEQPEAFDRAVLGFVERHLTATPD